MPIDVSQVIALSADLGRAGPAAIVKARRVVARTAHDIEATAKALAPVDTGALRASIGTTVSGLSAEIGPTALYGHFVEFGTSRMAPQPYMTPAADQHEHAFTAALEQIAAEVLGG